MPTRRIYNKVMVATSVCPYGELLTDKELKKLKNIPGVRFPFTLHVSVKTIYFSFGVRFATDSRLLLDDYRNEDFETLLKSSLGQMLQIEDYNTIKDHLDKQE